MMRADLNDNLGVRFEHLQDSLTYFYLCHNHYGRSRESDYLLEMIASRRLSKPVFFLNYAALVITTVAVMKLC